MNEWKEFKLGELAEITSSKRIFYSDYVLEGIPFFRSKEIIEKALGQKTNETLYISKERYTDIKQKFGSPVDGDLLISAVGERAGIPYVVKDLGDFYFKDGNLIWLRNIKSELNIEYFCYWLKSIIGQFSLESIMIGSAQKALTIIGLKNLEITIPNSSSQKAIASILSSLDDKIDLLHRQNSTIEAMAETLFRQRFVEEAKEDWDIAADENGNPVIAYAKFPNDSNHIYSLAFREKNKWKSIDLINSGGWYPETQKGHIEPEPNYSGGITIDHESPNTLFLSVKRDSIFEIEKWVSGNKRKSWNVEKITTGSSKNNVRPVAVRGAKEGNPIQVLWMQNTRYWHFATAKKFQEMGGTFNDRFLCSIKMNQLSPAIKNPLDRSEILNMMHQTACWQMANPSRDKRASVLNWHYGVFYSGIRALCELTGDDKYKDELLNIGQSNDWKPMNEIFNADRLTIVDTWAWLYGQKKDPKMIEKAQWVLDIHLARGYKENTIVSFKNNPLFGEWWSWCDALFMAPPAFAEMWKVTGNVEYLKYMDTQWWKTSDYLYSKEDSLFYRDDRYFDKRTPNGKKVYWGRGNGWVIAGLAKVLSILPEDFKTRTNFEQQYKEMAAKMLSLQDKKDGLWRVSLYDPEFLNIGESSSSALITYALAWGLNNGLLDPKYRPDVEKAWMALCHNVNSEGRLGFVQQVAGDPYPFHENQWHVYATGAFLMAGKEMVQLEEK